MTTLTTRALSVFEQHRGSVYPYDAIHKQDREAVEAWFSIVYAAKAFFDHNWITNGFLHFSFDTDADAVAFKLRYADDLDFID